MILAAVLTYNASSRIGYVVDALLSHRLRVVVIDNGSTEELPLLNAPIHRIEPGCGILHGRNYGFSIRKPGEGVLVIADDIIVPPGPWEDIMEQNQGTTLALRPEGDYAHRDLQHLKFAGILWGAPTSFQCVHFPSPVLDRIGYVDERYIWGDDGNMMRKNPHGVIDKFYITLVQRKNTQAPSYKAPRMFYEELWRPGKLDGEEWDRLPIRYTLDEVNSLHLDRCPTIWTMKREENPTYYDVSHKIREMFGRLWFDNNLNRLKLLEELVAYEAICRSRNEPPLDKIDVALLDKGGRRISTT